MNLRWNGLAIVCACYDYDCTQALTVEIAFAARAGRSWRFVNGTSIEPEAIDLAIPGFSADSPPIRGFVGGEFYDVVIIGSDAETGAEIFEHRQSLLFGTLYPSSFTSSSNGPPAPQSTSGPR